MPLTLVASTPRSLTVTLTEGTAEYMGEGLFIVFQSDTFGDPMNVVLTESDLRAMLAAC